MKIIVSKLLVLLLVFFLFGCSSDSGDTPCVPISCLNGGTSTPDCGCDCPQGYTGSDCSTQVTPLLVKITNIRVTKFPDTTPNGNWWDTSPSNSDADIFLTLENINYSTIWTSNNFTDSTGIGTFAYNFVPTTPIIITNFTSGYYMNIWDKDTLSSEIIAVTLFNPYSSIGGFPTTKTFTNSTSTFSFELTLSYVW